MKRLFAGLTCVLGFWMASAAYAHHSGAGFDRAKTVTLVGTVKTFRWANPHSWIEMEVANEKGATETWNVEMTSPAVLIRAGWKSSTIKPGDRVSVQAHPLQTGEPGGLFMSVTLADGATFTDKAPPTK